MHIWKMNFFFALRTLRFLHVHFPKATECRTGDSGFYFTEQKFIVRFPVLPSKAIQAQPAQPSDTLRTDTGPSEGLVPQPQPFPGDGGCGNRS